jgi:predicted ester cyclase
MVCLGLAFSILVGFGGPHSVPAVQSRQGDGQTDLERNRALVRRWIEEGFNRKDLTVVEEVFIEDFRVNRSPIGHGGLKQSMRRRFTAFPDLHVSIVEIMAERDKVGLWYTAQGTQTGEFEGIRATGKKVNWFGSDLLRVEGGRIAEGWFVDDSLGLLRQLGVTFSSSPTGK